MNVSEIMTRDVITVRPDMSVKSFAELLVSKDISGAPVTDEQGKVLGVVLEESLILRDRKIHLPTFFVILGGVFEVGEEQLDREVRQISAVSVSGIMNANPDRVSPETSLEDIATMITDQGKHYFLVMENGRLAGVVTKKDIVRAIAQGKIS